MTPFHWILLATVIVAWVIFWMAVVPRVAATVRRRLEARIGESPGGLTAVVIVMVTAQIH